MADEQQGMIPPGAGDPASATAPAPQEGSVQAPAQPAPDQGNAPTPDPASMLPADAQGQQVDGADDGGPRAKGTQADVDSAAVDDDPTAPVNATAEEQKQYENLVSRFVLFISDPRKATPAHASPTESVIAMMNKPNVPAAVALGRAAANIMFTMMHTAKMQKKPYDAEVGFYAADEAVPALYLLGAAHGIWKGLPAFKGLEPDGTYGFEDDEIKILGEAKMQGTRFIGNLMVHAGWITPDVARSNAALWKQRIEQEIAHGNVSDEVMNDLAKKGTFDKIHDQLGTTGFGGQAGASGAGQAVDTPTDPAAAAEADDSQSAPPTAGQPGQSPVPEGAPA